MTVDLVGHEFTNAGIGINGATVDVFTVATGADESTASTSATVSTTTDSSGKWDEDDVADGVYDVRIKFGSEIRWLRGEDQIQIAKAEVSTAVKTQDAADVMFGSGEDALIRWSTGDADNHSLVIAVGDSNQSLHITDKGAVATDWAISATTHPNVYVHSNTTPATDYLRLGDHDGTTAYVDVVGGTTLALEIAGNTELTVTSAGVDIAASNSYAVDGTAILSDSSGTMTLSNVDALDATTEATIEGAIDTLSNLASVGTITTGVWNGTAIASGYIAADAITGAKIADDAIDSEHYTDGSIDNAHLADDAVDSDEIAAGAIDAAHMSANSIDSASYVDGSIDNAHIADDAIDSEHYAAASIDFAHIQNVAANSILGRNANSSGVLSEVALATTQILIGDGTGFTPAALSGDATMTNAGVVSLSAAQTNITSLLATDIKIGEDDQTKIDFETADEIHLYAANVHEVTLAANELSPNTSDGIALGTTSKMWSDLFLASGSVVNFNNGDVTLTHSSNALTFDGGVLSVANTTESTSTTTGSIHTDGGLGVAKDLMLGTTSTIFVGDTACGDITTGLVVNIQTASTPAIVLKQNNVGHGMTDHVETDTFGFLGQVQASSGGLQLAGYKDAGADPGYALQLQGYLGEAADTTDTSGGAAVTMSDGHVRNGTAVTAVADAGNLFGISNADTTRLILKGDGDMHITNTTLTALDDVPDALLMRAGRAATAPAGTFLHDGFKGLVDEYMPYLERHRIMFPDADEPNGRPMQNVVPSIMLAWDGLYQQMKWLQDIFGVLTPDQRARLPDDTRKMLTLAME